MTLATYSEFGLIVAVVGVERDLLDQQWTSAIAVAVAVSFALAAPLNTARYAVYARALPWLARLERQPIQPDDALIDPQRRPHHRVRHGASRGGRLRRTGRTARPGGAGRRPPGRATVAANTRPGAQRRPRRCPRHASSGARLRVDPGIELVVLAMGDHAANLEAVRRVQASSFPTRRIAATATYPDEVVELERTGVDVARNLYGEAGQGLADDACDLLDTEGPDPSVDT